MDWVSRPSRFGIEDLLAELCGPRGFFFEAGAADGFLESTTYHLERFLGCRGLLIEPSPAQVAHCRRTRPASTVLNCALVPPERAGRLVELVFAGPMTVVAGALSEPAEEAHLSRARGFGGPGVRQESFSVVGRTISEVLQDVAAPPVDLMTLDVEGYEADVLRGLDLARHRPRHIMVEANDPARDLPRLRGVLEPDYRLVGWLTPTDVLFTLAGETSPDLHPRGALTLTV